MRSVFVFQRQGIGLDNYKDKESLSSGKSSVDDIVDIMKSSNKTSDGKNIITQLDDFAEVIDSFATGIWTKK